MAFCLQNVLCFGILRTDYTKLFFTIPVNFLRMLKNSLGGESTRK